MYCICTVLGFLRCVKNLTMIEIGHSWMLNGVMQQKELYSSVYSIADYSLTLYPVSLMTIQHKSLSSLDWLIGTKHGI